jgi:hypothetical protein
VPSEANHFRVDYSWDGQTEFEDPNEFVGSSDDYNRMGKLEKELSKLLAKVSTVPGAVESQASSPLPKSGCELLPLLDKIVIRFPEASRKGREQSYKIFLKEGRRLLQSLKKFVNTAHIKTFQLEDLRDFKLTEAPEGDQAEWNFGDDEHDYIGLMDDGCPRFRKLTTFLDKAFGLECEDRTKIHDKDHRGRGEGWEIYKAMETWTATGKYLVWNS